MAAGPKPVLTESLALIINWRVVMVWLTVVKCVSLSKINSLFCDTKTREEDETATLNSNHFLENDTLVEVVVGLWGHSLKNRAPPQKKQIRKVQRVEETELCYQCTCCLVSHRNAKL